MDHCAGQEIQLYRRQAIQTARFVTGAISGWGQSGVVICVECVPRQTVLDTRAILLPQPQEWLLSYPEGHTEDQTGSLKILCNVQRVYSPEYCRSGFLDPGRKYSGRGI